MNNITYKLINFGIGNRDIFTASTRLGIDLAEQIPAKISVRLVASGKTLTSDISTVHITITKQLLK
ncbi:hypothetical protein [Mucilaginibacter sp.]|uniref:hypothetical protein n=1 Tax=Mucilaginibacter sp. TaxID=1882438 RepID=UPI002636FC90|nr:hypothetical protein [Mucilaginibacter sp.]